MQVLFVCTANVCRSPSAERIAASLLGSNGVSTASAGTRARRGAAMTPLAEAALAEIGLDGSAHRAMLVDAAMARDADLLLTMTSEHRDAVLRMAPAGLNRTYTLLEAAALAQITGRGPTAWPAARSSVPATALDVADPTGGGLEEHRGMIRLVQGAVVRIAATLH